MARLGRRRRQTAITWYGSAVLQLVSPGLISQTAQVFAFTLIQDAQVVTPAIIDRTGAVFAPTVLLAIEVAPAAISNTGQVFVPIVGVQSAYPIADNSNNDWTDQDGGATDLYTVLDETVPDDADYVMSPFEAGPSMVEFQLSSVPDPEVFEGHKVRYRYKKDPPDTIFRLTVRLVQGTTTIAEWVHEDILHPFILIEQELTPTQADSITDYSDLRLQFETQDI